MSRDTVQQRWIRDHVLGTILDIWDSAQSTLKTNQQPNQNAQPSTGVDGELIVWDDTDATNPSGRIVAQANGTTFQVNADAGLAFYNLAARYEAVNGEEPPESYKDESRCARCGERFEEGDGIQMVVDDAWVSRYYDEENDNRPEDAPVYEQTKDVHGVHAVPAHSDCTSSSGETEE